MRALLALAALLALLGPAAATLGDNGLATFTGRKREPNTMVFGNDMVTEQALQATLNFAKDVLKGTWRPVKNDPPTEKAEVQIECLNSVAPEPLNWKMWCPGTDAKVLGWQDKSGAAHRQITLRPQKGMTSTMYQWFITTTVLGLMPPIVEYQGNHYHYYHLWHPLDHVESTWAIAPKVPILQKGMPIYVLIHERYRNPPNFPHDRHYETNGWFFVDNAAVNLMKNRYVITMPYMGIPTWTMILEFNDTPEGLVVDVEVVAGVPHKGYDDRAPKDGYRMAAGLNELFTAPLLARQKNSYDWEESINAITRHVIEEFSNLQHFVPYLYEKCTLLGKGGLNWVPTLGTWLQQHNRTADSASISFYHTLEKLAAKQVNRTGTASGALIDTKIDILNKTIMGGMKALTTINEQLSRKTFVPISNRLTHISHELSKANGAHPEVDVTIASVRREAWDNLVAVSNVTTETIVVGGGGGVVSGGKGSGDGGDGQPQQAPGKKKKNKQQGKKQQESEGDTANEAKKDGQQQQQQPAQQKKADGAAQQQQQQQDQTPKEGGTAEANDDNDDDDDESDRSSDSSRVPMAAALPAAASAGSPPPASSGSADDDDDDDDADEAGTAGPSDNPALALRQELKDATQEPDRATADAEKDSNSNDDDGADDGAAEAAQLADAAAFMDHGSHAASSSSSSSSKSSSHNASSGGGVAVASVLGGHTLGNKTHQLPGLGLDAAIEVPGISLGDIASAVHASGTKNVSTMIQAVKNEVLFTLGNRSVTFFADNSTLLLPEAVLEALSAKHDLHKGVLSALLNKTDFGLGSNVTIFTTGLPATLANAVNATAAAPILTAPSQAAAHPFLPTPDKLVAALAHKKGLLKGGGLAALLLNGSVVAGPPHLTFGSLAGNTSIKLSPPNLLAGLMHKAGVPGTNNSLGAGQGLGGIVAEALIGNVSAGSAVVKPGLKVSLQKLGESVDRAKRLAKSFRPSLSLTKPNASTDPDAGGAEGNLKLQVKFWDQQQQQQV